MTRKSKIVTPGASTEPTTFEALPIWPTIPEVKKSRPRRVLAAMGRHPWRTSLTLLATLALGGGGATVGLGALMSTWSTPVAAVAPPTITPVPVNSSDNTSVGYTSDPNYGDDVAENVANAIEDGLNSDWSTFMSDAATVLDDPEGDPVPTSAPAGLDPTLFNDAQQMALDAMSAETSGLIGTNSEDMPVMGEAVTAMRVADADYPDDSIVTGAWQNAVASYDNSPYYNGANP